MVGAGGAAVHRPRVAGGGPDLGPAARGYLYLHGNAVRDPTVDGDERIVFTFFRSTDGGVTFSSPKKLLPDGDHMAFGTGNGVVLSDGIYVASFYEWNDRKNPHEQGFRPRRTGRRSWSAPPTAATLLQGRRRLRVARVRSGGRRGLPVLAADTSGGPFRDRLYLIWPDRRSGRCEVLLVALLGQGESWSEPIVVNDDQSPADRARRRDHMLPAVAVNRSGVVGVAWSDRRESDRGLGSGRRGFRSPSTAARRSPPASGVRAGDEGPDQEDTSRSWRTARWRTATDPARAAAISRWRSDHSGSTSHAADTAGMAAASRRRFHPLWVDNRTGVPQVWTAAVRVDGEAAVNGSPELAALSDVTQSVAVEFANTDYDPVERSSPWTRRSPTRRSKPIVGRSQDSRDLPEVRERRARGARGGQPSRRGAVRVWDFTPQLLDGRLAPGQFSHARRVRFRLKELTATFPLDARSSLGNLISVETKALGQEQKP